MFISSQFTFILKFFLSRNLRIARDRAWDQTVKSRGKSDDFWEPYIEEWEVPPIVDTREWKWQKFLGPWIARFIFHKGTSRFSH